MTRGTSRYPPTRGTLFTLDDDHHALYTEGALLYCKTYPGTYVPPPPRYPSCVARQIVANLAVAVAPRPIELPASDTGGACIPTDPDETPACIPRTDLV